MKPLNRRLPSILFAAALLLPFQGARSELISTETLASEARIEAERDKLRHFLARDDAQRKLTALGVAPELAQQRVDVLTDAEVLQLAGKIDSLPAGGALSTTDLILIILIAIVIALLL